MQIHTRTVNTLKHRCTLAKEFYLDTIPKKMQLFQINGRTTRPHFILVFNDQVEGKRDVDDAKVITEVDVHSPDRFYFAFSVSDQYPELAEHETHIKEELSKHIKVILSYKQAEADTYY